MTDSPSCRTGGRILVDQLLAQHRGLFDLLEARASARAALDGKA